MIVGISSMPSCQEADGSIDGLDEEDDLALPSQAGRKYIPAPEEYSSESDIEEDRNFDVDSGHFNDDSSDSEDELAKNLQFSEAYTKEYVESLNVGPDSKTFADMLGSKMGENLISTLATAGTNLLSNMLHKNNQKKQEVSEEDSSSNNSEFEMITPDDLNEGT